jgi:hypothetical protein
VLKAKAELEIDIKKKKDLYEVEKNKAAAIQKKTE